MGTDAERGSPLEGWRFIQGNIDSLWWQERYIAPGALADHTPEVMKHSEYWAEVMGTDPKKYYVVTPDGWDSRFTPIAGPFDDLEIAKLVCLLTTVDVE